MAGNNPLVVRALYRGFLRAARHRASILEQLRASNKPTCVAELYKYQTEAKNTHMIKKWVEDRDLMFDMKSSDKWITVTLEMYGGDAKTAARVRFDEPILDQEKRRKWVEKVKRDLVLPEEVAEELFPKDSTMKIENGFLALRLLNELNSFKEACI